MNKAIHTQLLETENMGKEAGGRTQSLVVDLRSIAAQEIQFSGSLIGQKRGSFCENSLRKEKEPLLNLGGRTTLQKKERTQGFSHEIRGRNTFGGSRRNPGGSGPSVIGGFPGGRDEGKRTDKNLHEMIVKDTRGRGKTRKLEARRHICPENQKRSHKGRSFPRRKRRSSIPEKRRNRDVSFPHAKRGTLDKGEVRTSMEGKGRIRKEGPAQF